MIYKPKTYEPVTGVYAFPTETTRIAFIAVYVGGALLWQLIRSCYGTGIWIPDRPWLDNDLWKDNR